MTGTKGSGVLRRGDAERPLVLVVDDDPGVREVFCAALEHGGYEVVAASTGHASLEITAERAVDLVLLDVALPEMDGLELLARLRADPATESLSVVVVTADGGLDGKLAGLRAGANDYLVKPVSLAELLARVEAQLRDRSKWVRRINDQLGARSWLTREIAELDPQSPLPMLERQLLGLLDDVIPIQDLRIDTAPAAGVGPPEQIEVARWTTDDGVPGSQLRLPLRAAGRTVGLLQARISGEADLAVSTLTDLAPQIASLASLQLLRSAGLILARDEIRDRIADGGLRGVFQPIVSLTTHEVVGYEGLSRFRDGTPPDVAFAAALRAGVGDELEAAAISELVAKARLLPGGAWLSLNVSAASLIKLDLPALLGDADRDIVLEITEHEDVIDYEELRSRMSAVAEVRFAVDDAGAGYASLRHVFELRPDLVKLDRNWVDHIDADPVRRALVRGIVGFADALDADVVGEGIERRAEATTLTELGVQLGQGYHFGHPADPAPSDGPSG